MVAIGYNVRCAELKFVGLRGVHAGVRAGPGTLRMDAVADRIMVVSVIQIAEIVINGSSISLYFFKRGLFLRRIVFYYFKSLCIMTVLEIINKIIILN